MEIEMAQLKTTYLRNMVIFNDVYTYIYNIYIDIEREAIFHGR